MELTCKPEQPLGDATPVQTPTPTDLVTPSSFRTPPPLHDLEIEPPQTFSKRRAVFEQTPRYKKAAGTATADKSATSYKSATSSAGITRGFFKRSSPGTANDHASSPESSADDIRARLKAAEEKVAQLSAELDRSNRDEVARLQDEIKRSGRDDAESTTTTERSHRLGSSARKRGSSISAIRPPTLEENDLAERHKQLKKAEKELAALQQGNMKLNEVRNGLESEIALQRQELARVTLEKDAEVVRLKYERDACASLESEKLCFIGEVATLTSTMETLKHRASELEKDINTKSAELETVKDELLTRETERDNLAGHQAELQAEIDEAEKKKEDLLNAICTAAQEKEKLELEITDKTNAVAELKGNVSDLQAQLEAGDSERQRQQSHLTELEDKLTAVQSSVCQNEEKKNSIEAEIKKAQERLTDLEREQETRDADIKTKVTEIEKHEKRIEQVKAAITTAETNLKKKQDEHVETSKKLESLQKETETARKGLEALKSEVTRLETAKNGLENKVKGLREEETAIRKSRDTLEKEKRSLESDVAAKKKSVAEIEDEMASKKAEVEEMSKSSNEMKEHCDKLNGEVPVLQAEVDRLQSLVEANRKESAILSEDIKSRKEEISRFEQTISELKVMKTREHIAVQQLSKVEAEVCELEQRRQTAADELALIEDRKRIAKLDFVKLSSDCDALRQQIESLTSDLPSASHKASSENSRRASFSKEEYLVQSAAKEDFVLQSSASNPEKLVAAQLREVRDRLTWDGERIALEKDRRRLEIERDGIQTCLKEMESRLECLRADEETYKQKILDQQTMTLSLQKDIDASQEQLKRLQEDSQQTKTELHEAQQSLKVDRTNLEELQNATETETRQLENLRGEKEKLKEAIEELGERLSGEEVREKRVECEILEKEGALKSLAHQIAAADEELGLRLNEVGQVKSELQRVERLVMETRDMLANLRRECAEHEGVRTALMEKLRMEEAELRARSNAQVEEALAERERLRKAIEGMTTHYETLRRKAGELSRHTRPTRNFCEEEGDVLILNNENQTPSHNHRFSAEDSSPKSFADDQSYSRMERHRGWAHNLVRRSEEKAGRRATLDFPRAADCSPVSLPVEQPISWMDSAGKHVDLVIGRMRSTTSTEEGLTQEDYVKQLEQELAYFKSGARRLPPPNI